MLPTTMSAVPNARASAVKTHPLLFLLAATAVAAMMLLITRPFADRLRHSSTDRTALAALWMTAEDELGPSQFHLATADGCPNATTIRVVGGIPSIVANISSANTTTNTTNGNSTSTGYGNATASGPISVVLVALREWGPYGDIVPEYTLDPFPLESFNETVAGNSTAVQDLTAQQWVLEADLHQNDTNATTFGHLSLALDVIQQHGNFTWLGREQLVGCGDVIVTVSLDGFGACDGKPYCGSPYGSQLELAVQVRGAGGLTNIQWASVSRYIYQNATVSIFAVADINGTAVPLGIGMDDAGSFLLHIPVPAPSLAVAFIVSPKNHSAHGTNSTGST